MKLISLPIPQNKLVRACCMFLVTMLVLTCRGKQEAPAGKKHSQGDEIVVSAHGFSIERKDQYTVVTINNPWQGAVDISMSHYLVRKGSVVPEDVDSSKLIFVPVTGIICMSTTHVGMITALGEGNTIKGLSGGGYVFSGDIKNKIQQGLIAEVGYESNLNQELIIKILPELIMMYGIGSESAGHVNKLRELGINIMFNADYLESDPLGKAEWIKLFGALYCKEEMADSIFREEVRNYTQIRDYIITSNTKGPSVLLGLPFKDTWFISPGNSFISKLIRDAGGSYLWENTSSAVSMPYGLENVYIAALEADYWLNIGTVTRPEEISLVDKRLADLKCFKNKNLYNNNKRVTPEGGNDYWESGTLRPHLILKDIASILHPAMFPDHELYFYREIK